MSEIVTFKNIYCQKYATVTTIIDTMHFRITFQEKSCLVSCLSRMCTVAIATKHALCECIHRVKQAVYMYFICREKYY